MVIYAYYANNTDKEKNFVSKKMNQVLIILVMMFLFKINNSAPSSNSNALRQWKNAVDYQENTDNSRKLQTIDLQNFGPKTRFRRYVLQGSRWRLKKLTYKISQYPKNLNRNDVDREISRAFVVWSNITGLSFIPSTGKVNIELKFVTAEHGDSRPFDGPGGAFAHSFYPSNGGDVHFDGSENWTVNGQRGTSLFQVAVHELGHSLGLEHSDVKEALMRPFYSSYSPSFRIHDDDIRGIQKLYGKNALK